MLVQATQPRGHAWQHIDCYFPTLRPIEIPQLFFDVIEKLAFACSAENKMKFILNARRTWFIHPKMTVRIHRKGCNAEEINTACCGTCVACVQLNDSHKQQLHYCQVTFTTSHRNLSRISSEDLVASTRFGLICFSTTFTVSERIEKSFLGGGVQDAANTLPFAPEPSASGSMSWSCSLGMNAKRPWYLGT